MHDWLTFASLFDSKQVQVVASVITNPFPVLSPYNYPGVSGNYSLALLSYSISISALIHSLIHQAELLWPRSWLSKAFTYMAAQSNEVPVASGPQHHKEFCTFFFNIFVIKSQEIQVSLHVDCLCVGKDPNGHLSSLLSYSSAFLWLMNASSWHSHDLNATTLNDSYSNGIDMILTYL